MPSATYPAFPEDGDLGGRGVLGAADDCARVAHPPPGRGRRAGDEAGDGLPAMGLDPAGGVDFGAPADLADHDNPSGLRGVVEPTADMEMGRSVDRVAADADA